ncbi:MAG: hypothetical protein R3Y07_02160 [Eubacteriales bacterium]
MKKNGFLAGMICGVAMWGLIPTAEATVEWVQARVSPQEIYLDGNQVDWLVYNVGNQNFVRLADLCPAIDVGLVWDPITGYVLMNSDGTTPAITQPTPEVTTPEVTTPDSGLVVIPQSNAKMSLEVGDVVLCDDGYEYEITDMSRYENNMFQGFDELPPLPEQQGDWSNLPVLESLEVEVRHFSNSMGESMFITNMYETRRMQYTLYNLIANEPKAWDGDSPLATVSFGFTDDVGVSVMWPWEEQQLINLFDSRPISDFRVEAFDYYSNGIFQCTRYNIRAW